MAGWLKAYNLRSAEVWNVWEALRMFLVSTAIEQERQTEDKTIMYNIIRWRISEGSPPLQSHYFAEMR